MKIFAFWNFEFYELYYLSKDSVLIYLIRMPIENSTLQMMKLFQDNFKKVSFGVIYHF